MIHRMDWWVVVYPEAPSNDLHLPQTKTHLIVFSKYFGTSPIELAVAKSTKKIKELIKAITCTNR